MKTDNISNESLQEEWEEIPNTNGLCFISNLGRVKKFYKTTSKPKYKLNKFRIFTGAKENGYRYIIIAHKRYLVHRLVCTAFNDNPLNKPFVNHINGIKHDNRAINLEWCTIAENHQHAVRVGLRKYNSQKRKDHMNNLSRLKRKAVIQFDLSGIEIKRFESVNQCQKELNISNVSACCNGIIKQTNGFIFKYIKKRNKNEN